MVDPEEAITGTKLVRCEGGTSFEGAMQGGCQGKVFLQVFLMVPQTVCPHYGVLTVSERSGVLEVSFRNRGFRLRRHAQSSVCVDSVARNGSRGILGRFTGCPCTF